MRVYSGAQIAGRDDIRGQIDSGFRSAQADAGMTTTEDKTRAGMTNGEGALYDGKL